MRNPKVYVEVVAHFDTAGGILPLEIVWEDGQSFKIDRITGMKKAASLKAGGAGMRYDCVIGGHKTCIFLEEDRWFVERKDLTQ